MPIGYDHRLIEMHFTFRISAILCEGSRHSKLRSPKWSLATLAPSPHMTSGGNHGLCQKGTSHFGISTFRISAFRISTFQHFAFRAFQRSCDEVFRHFKSRSLISAFLRSMAHDLSWSDGPDLIRTLCFVISHITISEVGEPPFFDFPVSEKLICNHVSCPKMDGPPAFRIL
jgi:hypothetical protein